jgi:HSP20 family protein
MNTMVKTAPRNMLAARPDPFPRLMDWFESLIPSDTALRFNYAHTIRVEEFMRDGTFVVRAELPGIDPDKNVDVTVAEGMLTIRADREEKTEEDHRSEFTYGSLVRTIVLPQRVDQRSIQAEYRDGILEVQVAMPEPAAAPTHIPIKRAD